MFFFKSFSASTLVLISLISCIDAIAAKKVANLKSTTAGGNPTPEQISSFKGSVAVLGGLMGSCKNNFAPGWLRASFHDAVSFNKKTGKFGADGALANQLHFPQNKGVLVAAPVGSLNQADTIQAAATLAVNKCGGPCIPYYSGRYNVAPGVKHTNYWISGRAPGPNGSVKELRKLFIDFMGLDDVDMLTLTVGSHTLGGVRDKKHLNSKMYKNVKKDFQYAPFDSTPDVFDNQIFVQLMNNPNNCTLRIDCMLFQEPSLNSVALSFAKDQNAFFQQYAISFQKMSKLNSKASWLGPFLV
jgi:hypothetical protein